MSFILPDWRNEFEYPPNDKDLNLSFWAWQFLRRNKEYQQEWSAYIASLQGMVERVPVLSDYVDFKSGEIKQDAPETVVALASKQPEYVVAHDTRGNILRLCEIAEKWGLCWLENPASWSLPSNGGFLVQGHSLLSVALNNHHYGDMNYYTPIFDLRMPVEVLKAQFDLIIKERNRCIKDGTLTPYTGRPERSRASFHQYLRSLDAIDGGESALEIARVILKQPDVDGAKKVYNWIDSANKIRNGGYKLLPLHSTGIPKE